MDTYKEKPKGLNMSQEMSVDEDSASETNILELMRYLEKKSAESGQITKKDVINGIYEYGVRSFSTERQDLTISESLFAQFLNLLDSDDPSPDLIYCFEVLNCFILPELSNYHYDLISRYFRVLSGHISSQNTNIADYSLITLGKLLIQVPLIRDLFSFEMITTVYPTRPEMAYAVSSFLYSISIIPMFDDTDVRSFLQIVCDIIQSSKNPAGKLVDIDEAQNCALAVVRLAAWYTPISKAAVAVGLPVLLYSIILDVPSKVSYASLSAIYQLCLRDEDFCPSISMNILISVLFSKESTHIVRVYSAYIIKTVLDRSPSAGHLVDQILGVKHGSRVYDFKNLFAKANFVLRQALCALMTMIIEKSPKSYIVKLIQTRFVSLLGEMLYIEGGELRLGILENLMNVVVVSKEFGHTPIVIDDLEESDAIALLNQIWESSDSTEEVQEAQAILEELGMAEFE